ncbi:glycosyltransferase family 2 protein [uncultured Alistipes sp.]|uniref:glycosyltransferase family 2 protein n=1 Tax=uncultured Alistipes sp. TaxID=538949 RepID=UPI0025998DF8|nr:glycosyltransferase family 2 protein [uncultured Alistipes sp.]
MISVCMATYNGEKYIREQIDSILAQLGDKDELIVSDDGSADATLSIVRSFSDPRIKIISNTGKHGTNGNFENALKHAQGDYIFLSDQDDVWLPGKVNICLQALQTAHLVVHDCYVTDGNLHILHPSFFEMRGSASGFWKNLLRNSYVGACEAFRRSILEYALPLPDKLPVYHDGWLGSLADIKGKVEFIRTPLIYFRRHDSNTSQSARRSTFPLSKQISYRIKLLLLVIQRLVQCRKTATHSVKNCN